MGSLEVTQGHWWSATQAVRKQTVWYHNHYVTGNPSSGKALPIFKLSWRNKDFHSLLKAIKVRFICLRYNFSVLCSHNYLTLHMRYGDTGRELLQWPLWFHAHMELIVTHLLFHKLNSEYTGVINSPQVLIIPGSQVLINPCSCINGLLRTLATGSVS